MIKFKSRALINAVLIAALVAAAAACTVLFIFFRGQVAELSDKLAKSQAYSAKVESELDKLRESYDSLKDEYAKLEQTKAEEKNAKVVYLTFDDGPSENTVKILDILEQYNVKATFFIIGKEGGGAAEIYRRIISDGHAAGNHTYSHEYNEIYASEDRFWEEYRKNDETFFELTGRHLEIMRFPGGSNNTVSERYCRGIMKRLTKTAQQQDIIYFDWNVSSLDAVKERQDKNVIINSVLSGVKDKKTSIILMHDNKTKTTTVEALPTIIEELKKQGCIFKTLNKDTEPIQFLK